MREKIQEPQDLLQERLESCLCKKSEGSPAKGMLLHHLPQWLVKRLREKSAMGRKNKQYKDLLFNEETLFYFWLDHWGTLRDASGKYEGTFVSEPYELTNMGLQNLALFVERYDLRCEITGLGQWFQGVFRIELTPRESRKASPFTQ